MASPHTPTTPVAPTVLDWTKVVREKVERMRFGVVQIVVHDGKVTLIESTERTRFTKPGDI